MRITLTFEIEPGIGGNTRLPTPEQFIENVKDALYFEQPTLTLPFGYFALPYVLTQVSLESSSWEGDHAHRAIETTGEGISARR